jgi:elongation factor Tu
MGWFRRKDADSLDPQYLLAQAEAQTPPPAAGFGTGFRLTVEDVFTIRGRGTVVTGRVESGTLRTGDTVRQTRPDGVARDLTVTGIEMFRKVTDVANAGDNVGLLVRDATGDDIGRGDVLTR